MTDFALDVAAESIGGIIGATASRHAFPWLTSMLPANRALRGESHLNAARTLLEQEKSLFNRMDPQLLLNAHTSINAAKAARKKYQDSKWIRPRWSNARTYEEQGINAWKMASTASSKTREEILSLIMRPYIADLQAKAESPEASKESRNVLKTLYKSLKAKQKRAASDGVELTDISPAEPDEVAHAENPFDLGDDVSDILLPSQPLGSIQEADSGRLAELEHPGALRAIRIIRRHSV